MITGSHISSAAMRFAAENHWKMDAINDLKSNATLLRFFTENGVFAINSSHASSVEQIAAIFDRENQPYAWPPKAEPAPNVTRFPGITKLDLDPDQLLKAADGILQRVVIIGFTKEGEEYLAFSDADMAHAVFDIERAKLALLREWDSE